MCREKIIKVLLPRSYSYQKSILPKSVTWGFDPAILLINFFLSMPLYGHKRQKVLIMLLHTAKFLLFITKRRRWESNYWTKDAKYNRNCAVKAFQLDIKKTIPTCKLMDSTNWKGHRVVINDATDAILMPGTNFFDVGFA